MKKHIRFGTIAIVLLVLVGCRSTEVQLTDNELKIKGMYGLTIPYEDLEQIDTVAAIPAISMRTNGYALGTTLIGNFKLKDHSRVKLYVKKGFEPYILIRSRGIVPVYINFENRSKTIDLFSGLASKKK